MGGYQVTMPETQGREEAVFTLIITDDENKKAKKKRRRKKRVVVCCVQCECTPAFSSGADVIWLGNELGVVNLCYNCFTGLAECPNCSSLYNHARVCPLCEKGEE